MDRTALIEKAQTYLLHLCVQIPTRKVGSQGNQQACTYFEQVLAPFGYHLTRQEFACIDQNLGSATLTAGAETFSVFPSPYSLGVKAQATLLAADTPEKLETMQAQGKILLLHGELTKEQLLPKHFPFYNPEEHQRIYHLLEKQQPQAIVAATSKNPQLAGAVYPFPLIEDGDFDIPSVYMTDIEGACLLGFVGQTVTLHSQAQRIPSAGWNVLARKEGARTDKIVILAHIDAKEGAPGAADNAGGVVVLMLLAELLQAQALPFSLEILAVNGEDYYDAPGQKRYLQDQQGKFQQMKLAINLDGVGFVHGKTAYSLYGCPAEIEQTARAVFSQHPEFIEGEQWPQGDHSIFVMQGMPALALTTECFVELESDYAHTEKDDISIMNAGKLIDSALALKELLLSMA